MKQKGIEIDGIFLSRERIAHSEGKTSSLYLKILDNKYDALVSENAAHLKIISALLVFLGGLVAAFSGFFTVYCVCVPKSTTAIDYVFLAINFFFLVATFAVDIYGCRSGMSSISVSKDKRRPRRKKLRIKGGPLKMDDEVLTDVDAEEKEAPLSFLSMTEHYANDREDSINKLNEENVKLRRVSLLSGLFTMLSCGFVLIATLVLFCV